MSFKSEIRTDEFHIFGEKDTRLEQYIINRIIQLRQSKFQICNTETRLAGKTNMLLEINTRLSELEHIAIEFGFMYKTGFGKETFEDE